jgi:hypothetical protein
MRKLDGPAILIGRQNRRVRMVGKNPSVPLYDILSAAVIAVLVLPYSFDFNAGIVVLAGLLTPILSGRKYQSAKEI